MNVVIFGGTGSLGHALSDILKDIWPTMPEVWIVSRCELRQKEHDKKFGFQYVLGDVATTDWWKLLPRKVDYVINLAASKHVEVCEQNVEHAVRVNYQGVVNTYNYCNYAGGKYLFTTTDKAVRPINAYGMAKGLGQKFLADKKDATTFLYGNVLGSRGSVLHIIKEAIEEGKPVGITDDRMRRFWLRLTDVAAMIWENRDSKDRLHIPEMKTASVIDLAKAVAAYLAKEEPNYVDIGIRPGEKLIEEIIFDEIDGTYSLNSQNGPKFTHNELVAMVGEVLR